MTIRSLTVSAHTPTADHALHAEQVRWIHRTLWRLYGVKPGEVLNSGPLPDGPSTGRRTATDLHRLAKRLQAEAYDPAAGRLDYAGLARSPLFAEYRTCTRRLQSFDLASLKVREERLAFWINLYNALIIDAVISFGVQGSVQSARGFFWRAAYNIGGRRYAAHDIEHGILRANAPHPAIPGAHFAKGDPRRQHSLARLDPRIHFALVCGARSCPPISVYDAGNIDAQLDQATCSFVNGAGVRLVPHPKTIWLSKIFQWYATDFGAAPLAFGNRQPLRAFIAPYLDGVVSQAVVRSCDWPVRFMSYDWHLNT